MTEKQEQEAKPMTKQEHDEWVRAQFQRANKHLAEKGVLFDSVVTSECRYLAPFVAVWKIKDMDKQYYWVISGDVPVDVTVESNAKDARDVLRYFSMYWQMKAENIRESSGGDKLKQEFADLLIRSAQNIYGAYSNDSLWK